MVSNGCLTVAKNLIEIPISAFNIVVIQNNIPLVVGEFKVNHHYFLLYFLSYH